MADMTDYPNQGRGSEECARASRAALLGLLLWARYPFALILAGGAFALVARGTS